MHTLNFTAVLGMQTSRATRCCHLHHACFDHLTPTYIKDRHQCSPNQAHSVGISQMANHGSPPFLTNTCPEHTTCQTRPAPAGLHSFDFLNSILNHYKVTLTVEDLIGSNSQALSFNHIGGSTLPVLQATKTFNYLMQHLSV